ncbi:MAG: hypothetical protein NTV61_03230 [Candidatus Bathyarchaeota archaeon]|nr:hypothetical protein [Candidatus Bathyarchaeota archaeon]
MKQARMTPIIGVEAIRMLNEGTFKLKTRDELDEMQFGRHSRRILDEVTTTPMIEPLRVKHIARRAGLSEKQASLSLDCMVNRKDQVFTKFKEPDLIRYSIQYQRLQAPPRTGWLNEALTDLTYAIEDLGESYLALKMKGLFGSYDKLPWSYVPLIKYNEQPIYAQMQLQVLRRV